MLFASEIPVVAALNRFRGIEEVFSIVWKRTEASQALAATKSLSKQGVVVEEKVEKAGRLFKEAKIDTTMKEIVSKAKQVETVTELAQVQHETAQTSRASSVSVEQQSLLEDHISREVKMDFGTRQEHHAIKQFEKRTQKLVKDRNSKFYKKKVGETVFSERNILIGGRVDGLVDGRLIEVKNRIKQIPENIPPYDLAQVAVYLYLLGHTEGDILESVKGGHTLSKEDLLALAQQPDQDKVVEMPSSTRLTTVKFDHMLWEDTVLPRTQLFAEALDIFMADSAIKQEEFVRLGQDNAVKEQQWMIRDYWMQATQNHPKTPK